MAKRAKKKGRGRPRDECVQHIIEFADWNFDYMFGIDPGPFSDDPYMDFRHLNIQGKILQPKSITAPMAEVTLFPDERLSPSEARQKNKPRAVGAISHRGKAYSANLRLPADILGAVLQMMIAERYRYVVIEAEKSFRGEALIHHFRFTSAITDEDIA